MRRLVWLVVTTFPAAVVSALSWFGVFVFVNGYVTRELGWPNEDYVALMFVMTVAMFFWYPVCTEVSARIGRRWTVTASLTLGACAYGSIAFQRSFLPIAASLAVMASVAPTYLVGWIPFAGEVGGDRPGRAMALVSLVLNLVATVTLVGGGWFVNPDCYRPLLLGLAAVCAGCALAFNLCMGRLERVVRADHEAGEVTGVSTGGVSIRDLSPSELGQLLHPPLIYVILLGICAAPFAFQSSNSLFPNLSRDVHGLSETAIATLVGLGRLPSLLSLFAFSHLVDRLNKVRLYGAVIVLDALALLAMALAPSTGFLASAYLCFYLFHGVVWAVGLPAVYDCAPSRMRSTVFAAALMGEVASVSLVGAFQRLLLVADSSLNAVMGACAVVCAAAGLALFLYSFTRQSKRRPEAG